MLPTHIARKGGDGNKNECSDLFHTNFWRSKQSILMREQAAKLILF